MTRYPQSKKSSLHVREVLNESDASFNQLLSQAARLDRLESLLRGLVDPDMAAQFQLAAIRKNRLVLVTPTAAWATRIRMTAPVLIQSLQAKGISSVEFIDIRVAPLSTSGKSTRTKRQLSPAARQALDLMSQLVDDEPQHSSKSPNRRRDGG